MATSSITFSDWRNNTNSNLMSAAEELLEKLEDTSDLLAEIDEAFVGVSQEDGPEDNQKTSIIQRFHQGLDSARDLVNVLKREKWRLNKRQISVEMTMGELEEYKRHLKNDVSTLNQTVEALSVRVIQLENQLAEAQDTQEKLEAELEQHRHSLFAANDRNIELYTENEDLKKAMKELEKSNLTKENKMLKDELTMLTQENRKLKDMVRDAEAKCPPFMERRPPPPPVYASKSKEENLARLRKEFLEELTSLELSQRKAAAGKGREARAGGEIGNDGVVSPDTRRKIPVVNIEADV